MELAQGHNPYFTSKEEIDVIKLLNDLTKNRFSQRFSLKTHQF